MTRSDPWGLPLRLPAALGRKHAWMLSLLLGGSLLTGCGGGRTAENAARSDSTIVDTVAFVDTMTERGVVPRDTATELPPEPDPRWGYPALAASQVPPVYLQEWRKAENRESCAPIAPAALGAGEDARPRAATFSGGWAVAYDLPDQRSVFGVAGAGLTTSGEIYSEWTNRRDWPDGSFAEYGPEGGKGPAQLAYLRVVGQDCLYNVWSRFGRAHLELLLDQLRRVTVPAG